MSQRNISLDQVDVNRPCTVDWSAMTGDDSKRFCDHCQKHVHNLSAMTRNDAEALICASAGELCVQYRRDTNGQMITLDYAGVTPARWWNRWKPLTAVAAAISGLMVVVGLAQAEPQPAPPGIALGGMVVGEIACVPPPTTAPTGTATTTQPTTAPTEK